MKTALLWAAVILFVLLVVHCESENSPSSLALSRQVDSLNTQLDVLHEEIAASRSPDGFALLALLVSIGLPVVLAVMLLFRAEKTALHNDEIVRQIARHGLTSRLIETEKLLDHAQASSRNKIGTD